ncbi:expressed conserved protein [Echinococcus multilocularis]|uniref:Expressed conserved protein n=1 Tax=Echinococcus multilocularis TaxID=6211 RepID=A0A087VXS5_ECHMU|nr:expressed conserved protein [Echinococcus multilocularis]
MSGSGDNGCAQQGPEASHPGASNELLLEFLDSVMYKRFDTALMLCQKIIEAEPDNYEARAFLPMLEEASALKSTGYFNPLDTSSSTESGESSAEESEHKEERRNSSSSSDEWDYSTTTSDSDDASEDDG